MSIRARIRSILSGVIAKLRGRRNRLLAGLRRDWGRGIERERNMDVIATYHVSVARDKRVVENQTWQDLGMDDLFAKIDRTAGMPGRQMLYHEMRTYEHDDRILAERARQSYFFAEIRQILDFTRAENDGQCHLFCIDEIFRGTNTIERIAASTAVLRFLGQRAIVMATTHDVELQELLPDTFDMYHFNDQVVDGHYRFDYRIQRGPVHSRNAITLLAISGYPREIIDEAEALVARSLPQWERHQPPGEIRQHL